MNPAQAAVQFVYQPAAPIARPKPSAKANDPHKGRYLAGGILSECAADYIVEIVRAERDVLVTAWPAPTNGGVMQFHMQPPTHWDKHNFDDLTSFINGAIAMARKIKGGAQ